VGSANGDSRRSPSASDPGAVEGLRRLIGGAVQNLLVGERDPSAFDRPEGDPGLLGPDSVAWRVHGDLAGLIGGVRALFLQTMHPLAMAGVAEHSDYRSDPFGRLHRTAAYIAVTTFGSTEAATAAIARVNSVHESVQGTAPDGRPYSATDPELLLWVHATEVASFVKAVQLFGTTQLSPEDVDRYLSEMAPIAEALGAEDVPTDRAEMKVYWDRVRPELVAGSQAKETARFLLTPPLPLWARPAYGVITAAAVGSLPSVAREGLGLPDMPVVNQIAVRPAARAVVKLLGWSLGPSPAVAAASRRAGAG
jgi:uncharacterized protein (DUF2236 family)